MKAECIRTTLDHTNRLNKYKNIIRKLGSFALAAAFALTFLSAAAHVSANVPPVYSLQFLGEGSPTAINNSNVVVGRRISGNNYTPLVSENGAAWTVLPVPADAMSVFPTDVNDSGIIVGVSFNTQWNPVAVRWIKDQNGNYQIGILPRLPGHNSSYATGINNLGQIIGARGSLGYVPQGTGWLYSDSLGVIDLVSYNFWVYPVALNNNGIIIGGQERLNLANGQVDVIGQGPSNYNPIGGVAINDNGFIAGTGTLRSTSLWIVSLFRYEGATGWRYLTGTSRYTVASSINNLGDIGYGELGAGVYLEGLGIYAVGNLLDPIVTGQGWTINGSSALINDSRAITTIGRNTATGQTGSVLLTVNGNLPPPTAPANLQGMAHPATQMEPWNSINVTWQNTSALTRGYELQRREVNSNEWITLSLTPPGTMTNHTDTTVGVNITYEYRVRAVGLGGNSPWSNSVTVTSPSTPLDTTPPIVTILNLSDGANVSGIVPVSAQATDNVAVQHLEISFWNQYTGQEVIIGSVSNSGELSVNWDTRGLTPATYRLRAFAYDTLGNWTNRDISVNVTASTLNIMRVAAISLSASNSGNRPTVSGRVAVRNNQGRAVSGAVVSVEWRLPSGQTQTATAITNFTGNANFSIRSRGGTYTLTVTNVTKTGYTFDAANSILTASITP